MDLVGWMVMVCRKSWKRNMLSTCRFLLSDAKGGSVWLYYQGWEIKGQRQKIRGPQQEGYVDGWWFSSCFYECVLWRQGRASPYGKLALGIVRTSSYSMHQERRDMIRNSGVMLRQWCCMACYWMISRHFHVCFFRDWSFVHMINLKQQAFMIRCTAQL